MRIGLFVPCYIDAFFRKGTQRSNCWSGSATKSTTRVIRPVADSRWQTAGLTPTARRPRRCSCATSPASTTSSHRPAARVDHVRDNFDAIEQTDEVKEMRARTFELVEFLHDIQKVDAFPWTNFPHRVGLHNSCGTLRRLKHATTVRAKRALLLQALDLLRRSRESSSSARTAGRMLRLRWHLFRVRGGRVDEDGLRQSQRPRPAGVEYIVSADTSCLMHQQGAPSASACR